MIKLIACIDMNFGIGDKNGDLLFNLPKDMRHFKEVTDGKVIVMGRKTWDSLPIKPLKNRENIILTRDKSFEAVGTAKAINSIEEVLEMGKTEDIYVIGGGEIYNQFLPYAEELIITHVHVVDINARVFFPTFEMDDWKVTSLKMNKEDKKHKHSFAFATYERKAPKIIDMKQ